MWLYTYYEYPQKWRVKETTAPGLALQSFASTGLSGLEGEEWVVVHGGGCWINIIWQANIGVQGNKYTNMGIEMDRTSKKDWSSQRSKIVDYSPEGFGFALCNQACDDHSRSWLEGQGYTEMEQFAEKSVLRIWRLELEGLCSRLLHEDCCMKHERGSRGRELLNFDRLLCFFFSAFCSLILPFKLKPSKNSMTFIYCNQNQMRDEHQITHSRVKPSIPLLPDWWWAINLWNQSL